MTHSAPLLFEFPRTFAFHHPSTGMFQATNYAAYDQESWFPSYSSTSMHHRQPSMDAMQFEDVPQQPIIMRLADVIANDEEHSPRPACFRLTSYSSTRKSSSSSRKRSRRKSPIPVIDTGRTSPTGSSRTEPIAASLKRRLSFSTLRAGMRARARSFVTSALCRSMPSNGKLLTHIGSSESLTSQYSLVGEGDVLLMIG
jgi:hypothetical protein